MWFHNRAHLITPQMHNIIREQRSHFSEKALYDRHREGLCGVQRHVVDVRVVVRAVRNDVIAGAPRESVACHTNQKHSADIATQHAH